MAGGKKEREILTKMLGAVTDLREQMELLASTMDLALESVPPAGDGRPASANRDQQMKLAILDAINELEESRKAFKSKRLELLRKRLMQVLIEARG